MTMTRRTYLSECAEWFVAGSANVFISRVVKAKVEFVMGNCTRAIREIKVKLPNFLDFTISNFQNLSFVVLDTAKDPHFIVVCYTASVLKPRYARTNTEVDIRKFAVFTIHTGCA